jgi:hypothetical protein
MAERAMDETAEKIENMLAPERPRPLVPDGALLVLLVFDGLLLGAFGLMFTPLYTNGIPVPMGVVLSVLVLPWLVRQAGEIDVRPAVAGAPLTAWVVAVGVLGLLGPGGDAMLAGSWQSLVLLVGGIGAGLWGLRAVMEREYRERAFAGPRERRAGSEALAGRRRSAGAAPRARGTSDRAPEKQEGASKGPRARRSAAEADGRRRAGG